MVETSAHDLASESLVLMQFHNGISLVIEMCLTPGIMLFLRALACVMVSRVLGLIVRHLSVRLIGNGTESLLS